MIITIDNYYFIFFILEIDHSSDVEKYNVKPKSRKQPKQSTLSTLEDSSNALDSSDEEKYIVKPTKSRQQHKQTTKTTLMTLKDTSGNYLIGLIGLEIRK